MKVFSIISGVALLLYVSYRTYRFATLANNLPAKIAAGAVILDVRTPNEYNRGHLKGSLNISLGSLRQRYQELDTAQTYITCCSHGLRSVRAEAILKERNFKHVYNGGSWVDLQKSIRKAGRQP